MSSSSVHSIAFETIVFEPKISRVAVQRDNLAPYVGDHSRCLLVKALPSAGPLLSSFVELSYLFDDGTVAATWLGRIVCPTQIDLISFFDEPPLWNPEAYSPEFVRALRASKFSDRVDVPGHEEIVQRRAIALTAWLMAAMNLDTAEACMHRAQQVIAERARCALAAPRPSDRGHEPVDVS